MTDSCWGLSDLPAELQQDPAHETKGLKAWLSCPGPWGEGGLEDCPPLSSTLSL